MRTAGCHFSHIWIKPPDVSSQHHHKVGWADTLFGWRFSAECDCKQESVSGWETKNWIKADFDSMVALNENPSSHFPPLWVDDVSLQEQIWGDVYACAEAKCLQPRQEAWPPLHTGNSLNSTSAKLPIILPERGNKRGRNQANIELKSGVV